MTCMYQTTPSLNAIDFRALMPIDNNTSGGFQLSGCNGYYGGIGGGGGFDLDMIYGQTSMDLDIAIDDDGFLLDDLNSPMSYAGGGIDSIDSSPLSQSNSPSNLSSCSNSSSSSNGMPNGRAVETSGNAAGGRSAKNNREDKICGVCGDKALGFNFDAISCESCKAFFRRNAPKGLGYFKCPYDEKCKMDTTNRRFCKRCRLKKCFEIGMKKEYILTDEEKATKRRKIEENRYLKKKITTNSFITSPEKISSSSLLDNPGYLTTNDWQLTETKWQPLTMSTRSASPGASSTVVSNWFSVPLSADDAREINDLRVAYRNSLIVNVEKCVSPPRERASLVDLVNIAELSVRRVIAMVKQVTSFRSLPQVEQIHLLKGGSIELLIIRSVITFDEEKQHFLDPVDQEETSAMKLDELEKAENGLGLFEDHMKFIRSIASDLRADETTLILLLIICLFSPDRENLTWKDLVSREQEKYSLLLKKYLESIHPIPLARLLFPKLLMKLTDIRSLNEEHSQVLLKVKPEGIHPLMKEVLDLTS